MQWAIYIQDYPKPGDRTWCCGSATNTLDTYGYLGTAGVFRDINMAHRNLASLNTNPQYIGQYHLIEYPPK